MKTVKQWPASQLRRAVISVRSDTTVFDALVAMAQNHIGGAPVLGGGKVMGIFSELD